MNKTSKQPSYFRLSILIVMLAFFIMGCSSNSNENNENSSAAEENENTTTNNMEEEETSGESDFSNLYHEIGETFEVEGYSSGVMAEVTINDIRVEEGAEHQAFMEETVASPEEDDVVVFVDYTVENIGDSAMSMGDVIPKYAGPTGDAEIDLSYPENDIFTDSMSSFQVPLEAGESMELVGTIVAGKNAQYTNALMWNFMQDIPEIVFHTPQDERRDQVGIYDIGEDMYITDYGEDTFYRVNIGNIEVVDDPENIEKGDETNSFLAIDMVFENQLDEDMDLYHTFPTPYVGDQEAARSPHFLRDGQLVQDLFEGPEGKIEAGETVEGTVYLEIINENIEDIQLLYPHPALLTYPDYAMRVNYNLDN